MGEAKQRRFKYEQQQDNIAKRIEQQNTDSIQVDELVEKVRDSMQSLDLTHQRQVIQDVVSKIVIGKETIDVHGEVVVPSQSSSLTVGLKNESRHVHSQIPTIPFEFTVLVPKPRTKRYIVERDGRGRIIHSRSPALKA